MKLNVFIQLLMMKIKDNYFINIINNIKNINMNKFAIILLILLKIFH